MGLSISYQLTYILLVLNCHTNWPYTLYVCFWPLQKISIGQVCYKIPKIHKETKFNQFFGIIFLEKPFIYHIFWFNFNPIVLFWYYHLPFLSNIETQVLSDTATTVLHYTKLLSTPPVIAKSIAPGGL